VNRERTPAARINALMDKIESSLKHSLRVWPSAPRKPGPRMPDVVAEGPTCCCANNGGALAPVAKSVSRKARWMGLEQAVARSDGLNLRFLSIKVKNRGVFGAYFCERT